MKLLTTGKHNTVEWLKMNNFQNGLYKYLLWKITLDLSQKRIQRRLTDLPHRLGKKNKATFIYNVSIHAVECKANFINNYF